MLPTEAPYVRTRQQFFCCWVPVMVVSFSDNFNYHLIVFKSLDETDPVLVRTHSYTFSSTNGVDITIF